MAYDLSIFTKLYGQAGSSAALQSKFPFLCDLEALSRALDNHIMVTDSRMNPNNYTNVEMAYEIIKWFDKYADYYTGKMPVTIKTKANSGIFWNQTSFWYIDGIYELDQDPGFGIESVTSTAKYYVTPSDIEVADPTGSYHAPEVAQYEQVLYNYGPIDYVRRTDNGFGKIYVPNVSSNDMYSVFWETDAGSTTDTQGNTVAYDNTFPFNLQDTTEKYMGYNVRSPAYSVPNGAIDDLSYLAGYPDLPSFSYASLMFKADARVTSKSQTLASGGVAPTYSIVVPLGGWVVIDPSTATEAFPVTNMFRDDGTRPFNGTEIFHRVSQTYNDVYSTSIDVETLSNTGFASPYMSLTIGMKFSVESNVLKFDTRTAARGTEWYQFRGYPVYGLKVEYSTTDDPLTMKYATVNIAYNHLKNWNMYLYDAIVTLNTTGSKVIGNSTFVCGTDGVGGTAVSFTGVQTCYDSYVNVIDSGRGYLDNNPSTTITGGLWGRYTSSRTGYGKCCAGRIDEDVIDVPMSTKLQITGSTRMRPDRFVFTIANSWSYYSKSSINYQRPWFGSDSQYENQGFGSQVFLTSNKVESIGGDQKSTNTAFVAACPGYVFKTDYYHPQRNENGYIYPYNGLYGGNAGQEMTTNQYDFLNDDKFFNLSTAVYEVVITDGQVTGFTPISRPDGDGTMIQNGWEYYSSSDNIRMTFIRDLSVSMPSNAATPKAYYVTNGAATNGKGNKITIDLNHPDFFSGYNLPNDAYLYAIAYRDGETAPSATFNEYYNLDENSPDTADARRLFPDFYPTAIKITSERPVLRSTTRSLIDNVRSTGAQRYSFTYTYPPMYAEEAQKLIAAFEQYRSGEKAFSIRLPKTGFKLLNSFIKGDPTYSDYIQIIDGGELGSTEITIDGLPPNTTNVVTEGTYFKIDDDTKLYQIVRNANSNAYGQAKIRVEPGMKKDNSWKTLYMETYDYVWVVVRFADDALSYTTDGSGLYTLELNFVEALG